MKKILVNYLIVVCGLMAIVTLGLGLPVSAALRSLMYLSVPAMVVLGTLYIVIEHGVNRIKNNNNDNLINMPVHEGVKLAKSA